MAKYKVGDQVEIINYGHKMWRNEKMVDGEIIQLKETEWFDMFPEKVGLVGIIIEAHETQNRDMYSLYGIGAWYYNDNLKLIHRPEYKEGRDG